MDLAANKGDKMRPQHVRIANGQVTHDRSQGMNCADAARYHRLSRKLGRSPRPSIVDLPGYEGVTATQWVLSRERRGDNWELISPARWIRWTAGGSFAPQGWAVFEHRDGETVCVASGESISPALLGR